MSERMGTHWEGCEESHPECAAYREGFRAGMRAAAEIVRDGILDDDDIEDEGVIECVNGVLEDTATAILAEADK